MDLQEREAKLKETLAEVDRKVQENSRVGQQLYDIRQQVMGQLQLLKELKEEGKKPGVPDGGKK